MTFARACALPVRRTRPLRRRRRRRPPSRAPAGGGRTSASERPDRPPGRSSGDSPVAAASRPNHHTRLRASEHGRGDPVPAEAPQQARLRTDVFLTFAGKGATLAARARHGGDRRAPARSVGPGHVRRRLQLDADARPARRQLGLTTANPYFAARSPAQIPRIIGNALWLAALLGLVLAAVGVAIKVVVARRDRRARLDAASGHARGHPGRARRALPAERAPGRRPDGRLQQRRGRARRPSRSRLSSPASGLPTYGVSGTLAILGAGRYVAAAAYALLLGRRSADRRPPGHGALPATMFALRVPRLRRDPRFVPRHQARPAARERLSRDERGRALLGRRDARRRDVRPADGDRAQPLSSRRARAIRRRRARRSFALWPCSTGSSAWRRCLLPPSGSARSSATEFSGATSLYYWLLPGIFCLGLLTILSQHFAGRGYPVEAMAIWIFGLALNIALNLVFLPGRGAWVAALTSSVTYAFLLALHMWLFARGREATEPCVGRDARASSGRVTRLRLATADDRNPAEAVAGHSGQRPRDLPVVRRGDLVQAERPSSLLEHPLELTLRVRPSCRRSPCARENVGERSAGPAASSAWRIQRP